MSSDPYFLTFSNESGHTYIWLLQNGNTFSHTWNADWSPGNWAYVLLPVQGKPYFWTGGVGTGRGHLWKIEDGASNLMYQAPASLTKQEIFTLFASLTVKGVATSCLLAYDPKTGAAGIWSINSGGKALTEEFFADDALPQGFSSIMPFQYREESYLLLYNGKNIQFASIAPEGKGFRLLTSSNFPSGSTTFMPYILDQRLHFLSYNSDNGLIQTHLIYQDDRKEFQQVTTWQAQWSGGYNVNVPYVWQGVPHFLAYSTGSGHTYLWKFVDDGEAPQQVPQQGQSNWSPGYSTYLPFTFG